MLVLSRRVGQKIRIGNDIIVTVTRIAGGKVGIGIEASRNIRIMRTELDRDGVSHHSNSR